jgi:hypothetical protein
MLVVIGLECTYHGLDSLDGDSTLQIGQVGRQDAFPSPPISATALQYSSFIVASVGAQECESV